MPPLSAPASTGKWTPDHDAVYVSWRRFHVNGRVICPEAGRKRIARALREYTIAEVVVVLEWAHQSPDDAARWLQGGSMDSARDYLGLNNLLVMDKFDARLEAALKWEAAGRPGTARQAGAAGPPTPAQTQTKPVPAMGMADLLAERRRRREMGSNVIEGIFSADVSDTTSTSSKDTRHAV